MPTATDPSAFVRIVRPYLLAQDSAGLVDLIRSNWTVDQLAGLLGDGDADARKVAGLCLGLVGGRPAIDPLCRQLADADPLVHQMAEHALWSIWFRLGRTPAVRSDVCRGARAIAAREFVRAESHLDAAIAADPAFAEAYNQRAIVHYLREEYDDSVDDCRRTVELMPCHFGAWAGMGHCHLHLDRPRQALRAYRRALAIHPHMDGVRQAASELCSRIGGRAE
jgi:tetratricopeptide (TPR) repeat protein